MSSSKIIGGTLFAALIAASPACKKDEGKKGVGKTTDTSKKADTAAAKKADTAKVEPPKPMTSDELAKRYAECVGFFNAKDEAKFLGCYGDDVMSDHVDSGMPALSGKTELGKQIKDLWAAFPDGTCTTTLTLVNGKKLVSLAAFMGTHSGEMKMGTMPALPATNKKVAVMRAHVVEMGEDNLVHKESHVMDATTFMNQLGVSPMPGRPMMDNISGEAMTVVASDSEMEKTNLEAHKKLAAAWNGRDKAIGDMYAADAIEHDMSSPKDRTGTKEITSYMNTIWKGFPDAKGEMLDQWAAGDYTVGIVKNTGTNTGDVKEWKLKKTGKPISFTAVEVYKWEGGKIKEAWFIANGMVIAQQLGMMPAATPPTGATPTEGDKGAAAPAGDTKTPADAKTTGDHKGHAIDKAAPAN